MKHIDLTLSETGDKLNGLSGFTDDFFRRQNCRPGFDSRGRRSSSMCTAENVR